MAKEEYAHDLDEMVQRSLGRKGLRPIIDWVARFSYWVSPDIYREIQVVFPKTRRKRPGEEDRSIVDGVAVWSNQPASRAFWKAFGESPASHTPSNYRNFVLCHIYEGSVYDPNHFTNLANATVFPKCLESFSEWPPVGAVLKWHSFRIYGYKGPRNAAPPEPEYYPAYWPGVSRLDTETTQRVVSDLRKTSTSRPTYYSKAASPRGGTP